MLEFAKHNAEGTGAEVKLQMSINQNVAIIPAPANFTGDEDNMPDVFFEDVSMEDAKKTAEVFESVGLLGKYAAQLGGAPAEPTQFEIHQPPNAEPDPEPGYYTRGGYSTGVEDFGNGNGHKTNGDKH